MGASPGGRGYNVGLREDSEILDVSTLCKKDLMREKSSGQRGHKDSVPRTYIVFPLCFLSLACTQYLSFRLALQKARQKAERSLLHPRGDHGVLLSAESARHAHILDGLWLGTACISLP